MTCLQSFRKAALQRKHLIWLKGDLEFCRPSSGKCFASRRHNRKREAVNRKSKKSSRTTRGGTGEG